MRVENMDKKENICILYEDYFYKLFNMKGYKEFFKTLMEIYFTFT